MRNLRWTMQGMRGGRPAKTTTHGRHRWGTQTVIAIVLSFALPFLAMSGIASAQSSAVNVQGTIDAVDCQAQTMVIDTSNGQQTFATSDNAFTNVDSANLPFCSLEGYVGAPATVWLASENSQLVVTEVNVTGPVATTQPAAEGVSPLPIWGAVLGTVVVAGLLYLVTRGPDGLYYRYPYYGGYYQHYYNVGYRPYTGYYSASAAIITVAAVMVGVVLGTVIVNGDPYIVSRNSAGTISRYPYWGPYRQYYYRPVLSAVRGRERQRLQTGHGVSGQHAVGRAGSRHGPSVWHARRPQLFAAAAGGRDSPAHGHAIAASTERRDAAAAEHGTAPAPGNHASARGQAPQAAATGTTQPTTTAPHQPQATPHQPAGTAPQVAQPDDETTDDYGTAPAAGDAASARRHSAASSAADDEATDDYGTAPAAGDAASAGRLRHRSSRSRRRISRRHGTAPAAANDEAADDYGTAPAAGDDEAADDYGTAPAAGDDESADDYGTAPAAGDDASADDHRTPSVAAGKAAADNGRIAAAKVHVIKSKSGPILRESG